MKDLVVAGTFQERIFEKIKESIGDLMTKEDLQRLVEAAMQDAFFKNRVTTGSYGHTESKPPLFVEFVDKLLREQVDAALNAWIAAHSDEVLKLLNERINAGAFALISTAFDQKLMFAFQQFGEQMRQGIFPR